MSRLNTIRAEIARLSSALHEIHQDFPGKHCAEIEAMRTRLRKLRQQEFMLRHHAEPVPSDLMPLHRQNYTPSEQDTNLVVALLVGVAFIGIIVAFLLQAAGVLTK